LNEAPGLGKAKIRSEIVVSFLIKKPGRGINGCLIVCDIAQVYINNGFVGAEAITKR
jgi:hypothetical protein